ncbi:Peroxiredoxin-2C [Dactylella cylindrospora]|nr:Peroxiredoxin-2C [Dactylella cylindrospora]
MSLFRTALPLRQTLRGPLSRQFHASSAGLIAVGDSIPSVELKEDSPGNSVNIATEISGLKKAVIVGVPGAFSPACSANHVPTYIAHKDIKSIPTFVVAVNDPFVVGQWKNAIEGAKESGIRFLADPKAEFAKKMEMTFDKSVDIFGTLRNKRYAVVVEDGKVTKVVSEPDNTGVNETVAEKVL